MSLPLQSVMLTSSAASSVFYTGVLAIIARTLFAWSLLAISLSFVPESSAYIAQVDGLSQDMLSYLTSSYYVLTTARVIISYNSNNACYFFL